MKHEIGNGREPRADDSGRTPKVALVSILLLAAFLRISLALVNREANDDHLTVIAFIQFEGYFPHADDCWECFQPKLFHALCGAVGRAFDIQIEDTAIVTFQMINAGFGLLTLWILYGFLQGLQISRNVRIIGFGGVALNPELVGLNAQVTNDSLIILLGTLAIVHLWRFLDRPRLWNATVMAVAAALACITKATGLALLGGLLASLALAMAATLLRRGTATAYAKALGALIVLAVTIVPYFGQYYYSWKAFGDPFKTEVPKSTPPRAYEYVPDAAYMNRLGVTTLAESWGTFRIVDMLRNPYITHGVPPVPRHRASLWSQLYGRSQFAHFAQYPLSWRDRTPFIMNLGRAILVLALVPLLMMIHGFVVVCRSTIKGALKDGVAHLAVSRTWLMAYFALTSVAMMLILTYVNRDFSAMKSLYMLPFLICYLYLFVHGTQWFVEKVAERRSIVFAVHALFITLYALYTVDLAYLAAQLLSLRLYPA